MKWISLPLLGNDLVREIENLPSPAARIVAYLGLAGGDLQSGKPSIGDVVCSSG